MGRPVVIRSCSANLLSEAAVAHGGWPAAEDAHGAPIELELEVGDEASPGALDISVDGASLRLTGAGVDGWADARSLTAACRVPRGLSEEARLLASEAIDTLLLFLLTRSGRAPVHAAGVAFGSATVLLAGEGGAGKSTLSLAAMQRGLQILSDDTVYIQLYPHLRIWGFPRPVHVFPADARGFTRGTRFRAGKLKAIVPVPASARLLAADHAAVVLLGRGETVRLDAIEPSVAIAALARFEPGFDLLGQEALEAIAALTADGAWRLTLTRDPDAAIAALADRFGLPADQ